MSETAASAKRRAREIEGIRSAVADVAHELKQVSARVRELADAVESIGPAQPIASGAHPASAPKPSASAAPAYEEIMVTVRPLPELAMAAMAETSLRGLPGARQVLSVERVEDWARFKLEVATDADLISEMRAAIPVPFRVTESEDDGVSLDLKWLWGT
jgi:hypothetical protein